MRTRATTSELTSSLSLLFRWLPRMSVKTRGSTEGDASEGRLPASDAPAAAVPAGAVTAARHVCVGSRRLTPGTVLNMIVASLLPAPCAWPLVSEAKHAVHCKTKLQTA